MKLTIPTINRLHNEAMNMYSDYLASQEKSLLISACELEHKVAKAVLAMDAPEPSRCLILRSAALLAADVGRFRDAERHLCAALAGEPPAGLIDELRQDLTNILKRTGFDIMLRKVDGLRLPEEPG